MPGICRPSVHVYINSKWTEYTWLVIRLLDVVNIRHDLCSLTEWKTCRAFQNLISLFSPIRCERNQFSIGIFYCSWLFPHCTYSNTLIWKIYINLLRVEIQKYSTSFYIVCIPWPQFPSDIDLPLPIGINWAFNWFTMSSILMEMHRMWSGKLMKTNGWNNNQIFNK